MPLSPEQQKREEDRLWRERILSRFVSLRFVCEAKSRDAKRSALAGLPAVLRRLERRGIFEAAHAEPVHGERLTVIVDCYNVLKSDVFEDIKNEALIIERLSRFVRVLRVERDYLPVLDWGI